MEERRIEKQATREINLTTPAASTEPNSPNNGPVILTTELFSEALRERLNSSYFPSDAEVEGD